MRIRDVGALLALACAIPALSTTARAAPAFPLHLPADVVQGDRLLVQYGGGGSDDDDEDERPARPAYRPPSGGGGNPGAVIDILRGVGSMIQEQQRREQQQKIIQQQRRANEEAQRRRNEEARRAAEQARRDAAERARREEIRKRQVREDAIRQEKLKEQQDLTKQNDLKKKREDAAKLEDEHYNQPPGTTPANQPGYGPPSGPYSEPDEIDDVPIKVYVEPPENDYPDVPSLPDLVVGPTRLPACGYVNLPGDRTLCVGQTRKGGWLRIVNIPLKSGGAKAVCAQFCTVRPKIPEKKPEERFVYPAPQPTYPVQPIPPAPRPTYPATPTDIATKVTEPKRQPVPAAPTDMATKTVEPKRPMPAAPTDIATKVVEPKPQPVPAAPTDIAAKVTEPKPHAMPAVPTDVATKMTEPKRQGVPATATDKASPVKQPEWKTAALTDKASTVPAHPSIQPDPKRPQPKPVTPAAALDAIDADKPQDNIQDRPNQPESRQAKLDEAQLDEAPVDKPVPWFPGMTVRPESQCDAFVAGPRRDGCLVRLRRQNRIAENGPLDSKGCTAAGVKPLDEAIAEPFADFQRRSFSPREVVTTALSGIPNGVGGALSAIAKMFWKDDSSEKLFDAMKKYVDDIVPAAIGKYDQKVLKDDLTAINDFLRAYHEDWGATAKSVDLHDLKKQLVAMKPRYLNPVSPKSTLAEFVAFAALHLAALKEEYDHYDQYYPINEHEPNGVENHEHNRARVRSELNNAIKEYQDHLQALRRDIIADRLSKLMVNDRGETRTTYVGWGNIFETIDHFSAKDDFCDWQGPEHEKDPGSAQADVERRKAGLTAGYNKLIDELTAPIAQWKPI